MSKTMNAVSKSQLRLAAQSFGRAGGLSGAGGVTRWGSQAHLVGAAKYTGHVARYNAGVASRYSGAFGVAQKGLGVAGVGLTVGTGVWSLTSRLAVWRALKVCNHEECTDSYFATEKVTKHRFWFDKTEYCCPDGGKLTKKLVRNPQ